MKENRIISPSLPVPVCVQAMRMCPFGLREMCVCVCARVTFALRGSARGMCVLTCTLNLRERCVCSSVPFALRGMCVFTCARACYRVKRRQAEEVEQQLQLAKADGDKLLQRLESLQQERRSLVGVLTAASAALGSTSSPSRREGEAKATGVAAAVAAHDKLNHLNHRMAFAVKRLGVAKVLTRATMHLSVCWSVTMCSCDRGT